MPYANEHSARLLSPGRARFRVRRTRGSGRGKVQGVKVPTSISVVWYIIRTGGRTVPIAQALRFPANTWTATKAKGWLRKNKIKFLKFEAAKKKGKIQEMMTKETKARKTIRRSVLA